jgi:hypothetical protein
MSAISLVGIGAVLIASIGFLAIGNGLGMVVSSLFRHVAPART